MNGSKSLNFDEINPADIMPLVIEKVVVKAKKLKENKKSSSYPNRESEGGFQDFDYDDESKEQKIENE